jgi:orotate phosphoribosyltransferase
LSEPHGLNLKNTEKQALRIVQQSFDLAKEKNILTEKLAKTLLKIKAIRSGTFNSSDGKVTPYFIDLKSVPSFPQAFSLVIDCYDFAVHEIDRLSPFECLCAARTNSLVFASVLAFKWKKAIVFPINKEPTKGLRGFLKPGTKVLVIDDVSETGISMKSAVNTIRADGGVVENALTLIDRSESAAKTMKGIGVQLHSFTTVKELGAHLKEMLAMTEEEETVIESIL